MFLTTNDKIVNLSNVSNINIIERKNRIVFNMNYNIDICTKGKTKTISDYIYWDAYDSNELNRNIDLIKANQYFINNYIDKINNEGYININEVGSIKFSDRKNRVIFNLSHPVTFTDFDGCDKITSEFVYVNCNTKNQYQNYIEYIKKELGEM